MNYRALRLGLMTMCLTNPAYSANHSSQGDVASMELLEYLGSLLETNEGLFGPDLFIEKGINDQFEGTLKPNSAVNESAASLKTQNTKQSREEASNENN